MARLTSPIRKVACVFTSYEVEGKKTYTRQPYNLVSLDYGDGSPINSYIELVCGRALSPSERAETYDEVRFYDAEPFSGSRIGFAR